MSDAHHNVVQFAVAELLNSAKTGNAFLGMKERQQKKNTKIKQTGIISVIIRSMEMEIL